MGRKVSYSPQRLRHTVSQRETFMLFCEGETEVGYFSGFKVRALTIPVGNALTFVKKAILRKQQLTKTYTQYWVVFDKDDTTNADFNTAIRLALQNGFSVAYSNQAFELWFILHFRRAQGMMHRNNYEASLQNHLPSYNANRKGEAQGKQMFYTLIHLTNDAIKNAKADYDAFGNHNNPAAEESSTTVFQLVEKLNKI